MREGLEKWLDFFFRKRAALFANIFHRILREGCGLCRFWSHRELSAILGFSLGSDSKTLAMKIGINKGNMALQPVIYQGPSCTRTGSNSMTGELVRNAAY